MSKNADWLSWCNPESDFRAVAQTATNLNYTPEQLAAVLQRVGESYALDRGTQLLVEAFS